VASPSFSFQVNPQTVLGVGPEATLQDIRDAYRVKAKKYHPDAGGEEWAFRILVQAYEILSTARVVRATQAEEAAPRRSPAKAAHTTTSETVRPGVQDETYELAKIVDVEKLWIRFEVDHVWLLQGGAHDDRFLSCSLNIAWPDARLAEQAHEIPNAEKTLRALTQVFDKIRAKTKVVSSNCKVEDHRFEGWLSYPNLERAGDAFKQLHDLLHANGLGVKQWSRDLFIPRDWR